MSARGLLDELVFVFLLVMFIRMFVVEIYKIPTGSMTPTLLGGQVSHIDVTGDGSRELLYWDQYSAQGPLMYEWDGERYVFSQRLPVSPQNLSDWRERGLIKNQYDRILVSKLPYLFHPPQRGDIVVFKVPPEIYNPDAPIYIKRVVGEPGDQLEFTDDGRLIANDVLVSEPEFFQQQRYDPVIDPRGGLIMQEEIDYRYLPGDKRLIEQIQVPEDEVYVFGDNAFGSLDSRYWGGVPIPYAKGRAFLRILPLNQIRFLQ